MDSPEHILKFSLQSAYFSSHMAMKILFHTFLFVFLLFKALNVRQLILVVVLQLTQTAAR